MSEQVMPDAAQPAQEAAPEASAECVTVVVSSRVKEVVKGKGLRSDGRLADAVNAQVVALIERATAHAMSEGRATVRPEDVLAAAA